MALLTVLVLLSFQPASQDIPAIDGFKGDIPRIVDTLGTIADSIQDKTTPLDEGELLHFTYTEKEVRTKLNSKGETKGTETNLYQVTRGPDWWQFYRKQTSRNGVALSAAELSKQDAEQRKREQKQRAEIERIIKEARESAEKQKANPKPAVPQTAEQRNDAAFRYYEEVFDIRVTGREAIDGHPAVLITMQPKPGARTKDGLLKMLKHIVIRGWITEREHQLIRIEADVVETISFGLGFLARFQKGSKLFLERRPINNDVWAPVKVGATMNARILLLKGINERQASEFSDFKKFTVETTLKVIEGDPADK
jgi:hypothetical protein